MLILAIDTSTNIGTVAIYDNKKGVVGEITLNVKQNHSAITMTTIDTDVYKRQILALNVIISFPMGIFSTNITSREKFIYQRGVKLITIILNPIVGAILMINGFGLIAVTVSTVCFAILSYFFDIDVYKRQIERF